jgi:multidrug resistance efflux pump
VANDERPAPADLDELRRKVDEHERRIAALDAEMQEFRRVIAMRKIK